MRRRDWVRPGIMLYGISPFSDSTGADLGLKPVMTLETRVIAIKSVAAGDRVGYGGTWTAKRPSRIAIAAAGYGDGYPRSAASGTPVRVNGMPAEIAGRVSMDMLAIDVSDVLQVVGRRSGAALGTGSAGRAHRGGGRHHRLRTDLPRQPARSFRAGALRILLTGSSGRIGGAIGARLSLRHPVTGIDRRPGALTTEVVDLRDTQRIAPLLKGVDAVVHTASLHVPDLAAQSAADFRAVNVEATRRLLAACGEAGVRRFIYTSTTSLYGDAMLPVDGAAAWVTESLVPQPRDVYDETKLAAEQACREAARAGLACVSLRMSRCFPEDPRLVAIYRLYRGVDARDVAQAHELALTAELADFEVFNVSARSPFARGGLPCARGRRGVADRRTLSLGTRGVCAARLAVATVHRPRLCCGPGDRTARLPADARLRIAVSTPGRRAGARGLTMSSVGYHEAAEDLSDETRDMHRAIVSLMEELEAIDWYNQRADACKDPELRAILAHNRDEEKEHAAMVLEWIRRHDPRLSKELKDYLFTTKPIRDEGHE